MSGSYNLDSARSSELHFSDVVELDLVDESRVYFTVRGIEGKYSMLISSILVAEFSLEIGDVEVGDKLLFLVYKDGKLEGRLETIPGIVEGKDDSGLDISIKKEKIQLSFNQLKGDLNRVKIGDTVHLRRRNGRYFKGYFRYYPQQHVLPSDPAIITDFKSALDALAPDTESKPVEVQEHYDDKLSGHLQYVEAQCPSALESNIQELDEIMKFHSSSTSKKFIETLKHFFHSYQRMFDAEDSFYKEIITRYLETLCNSIYPSNISQDFKAKLSEAQGMYAVDDKTEGSRKIVLSHLDYLLSLKSNSKIRSSEIQEIISEEAFVRPFITELRVLADNFLRQSRSFPRPGHIQLPFENIIKALSEILNIKIVLFDIVACTYSQYSSSRFNLILYYLNNKSLDRLYLHYEHRLSSAQVSHSDLQQYRCNLCNLLPHESVLSLEDTCYCSNCLGYLVSKGMHTCNICECRHSSLTIQAIKQKKYICSGCQCEYNYIDFIGEIQCSHGLCKVCTEISQKQGACKGCGRVLKPEEVHFMIKCGLCRENKFADNFTVDKMCQCDICDDCVLEVRKNGVKCRNCKQNLYDRNVEICVKCGKIDSSDNGMMPECNHFSCKDCSKNALKYSIDQLIFPPRCSICQSSLKPSDYSQICDPHKLQKHIEHVKQVKVQSEVKKNVCGICRVPYRIDNIRTLLCDHSFCDDCMLHYILSWLDNTIRPLAVTCPRCPVEISPVTLQAVMPTTEFDIYSRTCYNSSNTWCRKCNNDITLSNDNSTCTHCDVKLCKVCGNDFHAGDCDPSIIRRLKEVSHSNKELFRCPTCEDDYFSSQMNDKAVCIKCLTKFCLLCYRLYNPIQIHGYHFHSSRCIKYKPTYKSDQYDHDCIDCRRKGSLCYNRANIIQLDT